MNYLYTQSAVINKPNIGEFRVNFTVNFLNTTEATAQNQKVATLMIMAGNFIGTLNDAETTQDRYTDKMVETKSKDTSNTGALIDVTITWHKIGVVFPCPQDITMTVRNISFGSSFNPIYTALLGALSNKLITASQATTENFVAENINVTMHD